MSEVFLLKGGPANKNMEQEQVDVAKATSQGSDQFKTQLTPENQI